jgi:D-arabinose 1-dehydrogenase-like Zn-dependent alcohol dehydrogenase
VLVSSDEEALKAEAGTFDGIIDTVSAPHDLNALLDLLGYHGKLVLVGLPPGATVPVAHGKLIFK